MKLLMKPIVALAAAVTLTATFATPASAKNGVPLKGSYQAVEETVMLLPPEVPFPTLLVLGSGSGHAAHLGRFTIEYEFEVNLENFFGVGTARYTSASGDSFTTYAEGQGTVPTADGLSFIIERNVITGGTGRFAGVTGAFTNNRVLNVITHESSSSFEGFIGKH
jgi:hypothetical protein